MAEPRDREIIRQFPENGMKLLLHNAQNVRDLLRIARSAHVENIDFAKLRLDPTTYVTSDFRHVESDLVFTAPLRSAQRRRKSITLYILLEHQSEPDRLMVLRLLEYLVQIWKAQTRIWKQQHGSTASVRLQPILPIVFYTGTHRWERIGQLTDLIEEGKAFEEVTPIFKPLFVNLPDLALAELERGGFFGRVLQLVRERRARAGEFRDLLRRVVQYLETMPPEERSRWQELLSYVSALLYHERAVSEQASLHEALETSLRTDEHRQRVTDMRRTMADIHRDEGSVRSLQEVFLSQLRECFGELPASTEQTIQRTKDIGQLRDWMRRFATAERLEDVGINE